MGDYRWLFSGLVSLPRCFFPPCFRMKIVPWSRSLLAAVLVMTSCFAFLTLEVFQVNILRPPSPSSRGLVPLRCKPKGCSGCQAAVPAHNASPKNRTARRDGEGTGAETYREWGSMSRLRLLSKEECNRAKEWCQSRDKTRRDKLKSMRACEYEPPLWVLKRRLVG